ncbi:MAG TPA: metallopeptidase TldD-related protein [Bryobacteraceae bacterium]|nr:metallopeptidase TldD-related protein [Bryobacteraceae bacterium]
MKNIVIALLAGATLIIAAEQPDPVLNAMKTELKRATSLSLNQLDKPYFVSYSIDDIHSWTASAMLGALISANTNTFRVPNVRIRVGDYKFDNTNFAGGFGGGARYDLRGFPLDDDPLAIRQFLWLATDSAYKGSLQSIARKRSALRSVTVSEELPDFSIAPKLSLIHEYQPAHFNDQAWKDEVRRVSTVFSAYPALRTSLVELSVVDGLHRFVNSEGTEIREPEQVGSVQIRASAQSRDGMIVRDARVFYTHNIDKLIPEAELQKAAKSVGDTVVQMAAAPMGDNYSGPILFEGVASAQMMAEVLGRNLHIARKPVTAPGAPNQITATELEGRRGVRIMPEFFDVTDDPSAPMFGHEEVDDEGVADKKVALVEKGVLKDFLRTREPVRGYSESNGHSRLTSGAAVPTNLIIKARETNSIEDLRKKMIDLCQQRGLSYGIIVRRMDFPSSATVDEARRNLAAAGSSGRAVSLPLHVYRLYTDGHEELIRGVRLRGLNARSLKDILAAGDDNVEFNYLENGAPFALLGLGASSAEVTVVAPSVLIDDLELTKIDDELPKLPVAPPPALSSSLR